jgi:hypothetical protein
MMLWMASLLPTRAWDWMMRKIGFLDARSLNLAGAQAAAAPKHDVRAAS